MGISDLHKFIVTALRTQVVKGNSKTKYYRDYNFFDIDLFKEELLGKLNENVENILLFTIFL